MKKLVMLSLMGLALFGCKEKTEEATPAPEAAAATTAGGLDTEEKKVSYAIGYSVAKNIGVEDYAFDSAVFVAAVEDVRSGAELKMTEEEMGMVMQKFQMEQYQRMVKEQAAEGEAFLAENAKKEGITVTESGLQYEVLVEGTGAKPAVTDTVVVHYSGSLLDGTVFDSSYKRGTPAEFGVGNLIKGWIEALQLMPVGSKWKLYIPYDIAYGDRGSPPKIPPMAALIFEMELISIKGQEKEVK